jgi:hypothetical protein
MDPLERHARRRRLGHPTVSVFVGAIGRDAMAAWLAKKGRALVDVPASEPLPERR